MDKDICLYKTTYIYNIYNVIVALHWLLKGVDLKAIPNGHFLYTYQQVTHIFAKYYLGYANFFGFPVVGI